MKIGSLFSGVEGFGLGFEQAGCKIAWQVEKEKFCLAVLARHWPKVPRYTEIEKVGSKNLTRVDCITAGVPCQDVSIAGKRAGLAGKRTGLFHHFARILQELRPTWFVFENVPGLFSSNGGRDFAEVLRIFMVECGYGVSWRVLDSRYFNVAQRRERVFIVGCLGAPCPPEILFESSSGGGDPEARGQAREGIAVPLTSGAGRSGRRMEDDWNIVRQAISSKWSKGTSGPAGDEPHNLVAATLSAEYSEKAYRGDGTENVFAFDTTQITHPANRSNPQPGDPSHPLASGSHAPAVCFESRFARNGRGAPSGIVPPLKAESGGTGKGDGAPLTIAKCLDGHHRQVRAENGNYVRAETDPNGVRDFAGLPKGMDSPRYRALGNAVTTTVAYWIAKRLMEANAKCSPS